VILVVHCTEDDVELVVLVRLERFRKSLTGPRIVRTVQNDQWSGIHHLEPARPVGASQPALEVGVGDIADLPGEGDGNAGVLA